MKFQKSTYNCCFVNGDQKKYYLQLGNNEKQEIFFKLLWGENKPTKLNNGINNVNENIETIDHISFHQDGKVHIVYYRNNNKRGVWDYMTLPSPLNAIPKNNYAPLLIFSIYNVSLFTQYLGNEKELLYGDHANTTVEFNANNINRFSVLFFLVGSEVDCIKMLGSNFPGIFSAFLSKKNFFDKNGNDAGLLIAYTEKVLPKPPVLSVKQKNIEIDDIPFNMRLVVSKKEINTLE